MMTPDTPRDRGTEELPKGKKKKARLTYLLWLVPIAAAAAAAWFFYSELVSKGPVLHITFDNAKGLEVGKSQLKYRGIVLGKVDTIELSKDGRSAQITIKLKKSGERVAREGSIFWIVKPRVGVQQVTGLGTIVSGDYVAVVPGHGKKQTTFTGRPAPPLPVTQETPIVRIVLLAERLGSQRRGTPVQYRGVNVGQVADGELGPTAQTVRILLDINKEYAPLVRLNSKFWNAGGINFSLGLSGVGISAQSAQAVMSGAISFATPDTSQKEAPEGTMFRLYDKPDNQWLGWAPEIRVHPHHHSAPATDDKEEKEE